MKKAIKMVLVLALAVLCLTAVAAAAEGPASGICDVTVVDSSAVEFEAQTATGAPVTTATTQEGKQVYADAVQLKVTYKNVVADAQYVVLAFNVDGNGNTVPTPTESNVVFIDQNGTANFNVYPSKLENGKTYHVYLSSNSNAGGIHDATEVLTFSYYAAYKLGDVDNDGRISPDDALCALQIYAGMQNQGQDWTENEKLAANVDKDDNVTPDDALKILQFYAGQINEF